MRTFLEGSENLENKLSTSIFNLSSCELSVKVFEFLLTLSILQQPCFTWMVSLELHFCALWPILAAIKENSEFWVKIWTEQWDPLAVLPAPTLYLGLSVSVPVPLSLSGCFEKLPNTPGWGRSFALVLANLSLTPCSWILDLLVGHRHFQDSSYLEHSCAEILWYFSWLFCFFFFLTPSTPLYQYSEFSLLPWLFVCWLSYPISPTYLTVPSISNNLNSFSSRLSCFQFLPIPQSSTITFSEKPSLTSLMRSYALLTCVWWDVDIPSTALPWCMAWHIGWMSISNTTQ